MKSITDQQSQILSQNDPWTQPSFSLKNRLSRLLWLLVYYPFFRLSPRPFHVWRSFILRLFGAEVGTHCHVYPSVKIWAPWNLYLDDFVGIGDNVTCYSIAPIHIGSWSVVSQGSHLCTGTHDYEDPNFQLIATPITIGSQVWICAEAFISPGVTVYDGAVVGARSVVTKDVPTWTVCAGNPCKPIKPRILREK